MICIPFVKGKPVSLNNAYFNVGGRGRVMSTEARNWKAQVQWTAMGALRGKRPLVGRVSAHLTFVFTDRRRRDIDNLAKLVLDGIKGVAYADDSQIDELHIYRTGGKEAGVHIGVDTIPQT